MENELPYQINDADNHFNEQGDCFERYIDPKHKALAIREVNAPDGTKMQLFAGKSSKFHMEEHVLSKDQIEKLLGDTSKLGLTVGKQATPEEGGARERVRVPGMLLTRL